MSVRAHYMQETFLIIVNELNDFFDQKTPPDEHTRVEILLEQVIRRFGAPLDCEMAFLTSGKDAIGSDLLFVAFDIFYLFRC